MRVEQTVSSSQTVDVILVTDSGEVKRDMHGVNTTVGGTARELSQRGNGFRVLVIHRDLFRTVPNIWNPSTPFALASPKQIYRIAEDARFDLSKSFIHILTEGPVGWAMWWLCKNAGLSFTTAFTTRWDRYLKILAGVPESASWFGLKQFHERSSCIMPPSESIRRLLVSKFARAENTAVWGRGVDCSEFYPGERSNDFLRPMILNVGRVSHEKNLEELLQVDHPGSIHIVGDGPARRALEQKYSSLITRDRLVFHGAKRGAELRAMYQQADVFAFPSRTDTLGNVNLEALACGVPIATLPEPGGSDIVGHHDGVGAIDSDLNRAIAKALCVGRQSACVALARKFTRARATDQLLERLVPARQSPRSSVFQVSQAAGL